MSLQHTQLAKPYRIQQWLMRNDGLVFILFSAAAAFITYCSMYAFRKPFTAATFEGLSLWGMDYKIVLIIAQAIGYTLSKFLGIKLRPVSVPKQHWLLDVHQRCLRVSR